mmetsp:Transcript_48942/g.158108  ORF Transcript_48942/g.158108 Transcript_48942/m.158108 type:complete len:92 (+) Transcript_48942:361-636(+)
MRSGRSWTPSNQPVQLRVLIVPAPWALGRCLAAVGALGPRDTSIEVALVMSVRGRRGGPAGRSGSDDGDGGGLGSADLGGNGVSGVPVVGQ